LTKRLKFKLERVPELVTVFIVFSESIVLDHALYIVNVFLAALRIV